MGDWFRFETGRSSPISDGANGVRVPVTSRLGATVWTKFHVDVVAENIRMTGTAEDVPPLPPLDVPGLERSGYRAYPLVDHIADKTCAILERHGPERRPFTRFKDLVDIVSVVSQATLPADEQHNALRSEAERRDLALPQRFSVPDRSLWEPGYSAEAARALALPASTLDQALVLTEPFLNPLLDGRPQEPGILTRPCGNLQHRNPGGTDGVEVPCSTLNEKQPIAGHSTDPRNSTMAAARSARSSVTTTATTISVPGHSSARTTRG